MRAALADEPGQRFLGVAVIGDQPPIALGLLDGVEVPALDILEECDLECFGIVEIADDDRDLMEPRPLRRPPAALAGDDLVAVAVRPDDDRLDEAALLDRGGELLE